MQLKLGKWKTLVYQQNKKARRKLKVAFYESFVRLIN